MYSYLHWDTNAFSFNNISNVRRVVMNENQLTITMTYHNYIQFVLSPLAVALPTMRRFGVDIIVYFNRGTGELQ